MRALVKIIAQEYYHIAEEKEKILGRPIVSTGLKVELYLWFIFMIIGNALYKYLDYSAVLTLSWVLSDFIPLSITDCLPIGSMIYYLFGYFILAFAMKMQDRILYKYLIFSCAVLIDIGCMIYNTRLMYVDPQSFWLYTLISMSYSIY